MKFRRKIKNILTPERIREHLEDVTPRVNNRVFYVGRLNENIIRVRGGKDGVVDRLVKWVVFYDTKATALYKNLYLALKDKDKNPVLAGELLRDMGKVHDRLGDFANKILPYITPKLQSLEINKKITRRFVIRTPTTITSTEKWLEKVKSEQKLIPKFNVDRAMNNSAAETVIDVVENEIIDDNDDNGDGWDTTRH